MGGRKGNAPSSSGPQPDVLLLNYQPHMAHPEGFDTFTNVDQTFTQYHERVYFRQECIWWNEVELNYRPRDFQSPALPSELSFHMVDKDGIEPSTSELSAPRSNQLSYSSIWCRRRDSNPHDTKSLDFKSNVYASSTTPTRFIPFHLIHH